MLISHKKENINTKYSTTIYISLHMKLRNQPPDYPYPRQQSWRGSVSIVLCYCVRSWELLCPGPCGGPGVTWACWQVSKGAGDVVRCPWWPVVEGQWGRAGLKQVAGRAVCWGPRVVTARQGRHEFTCFSVSMNLLAVFRCPGRLWGQGGAGVLLGCLWYACVGGAFVGLSVCFGLLNWVV